MTAGTGDGIAAAVRFDLKRMHETWMEFIYPRQRSVEGTVLGKWQPDGGLSLVLYRLWSIVGAPVVALVYPLVLLGYFVRFQTRRLNTTALSIGFVGVGLELVEGRRSVDHRHSGGDHRGRDDHDRNNEPSIVRDPLAHVDHY